MTDKAAILWIDNLIARMKEDLREEYFDPRYVDALELANSALEERARHSPIPHDSTDDQIKAALGAMIGKPKTLDQVKEEIGDCGEVMTSEEFKRCVECGGFIPYDGDGYYHNGLHKTDINVWETEEINTCFPYVIWYNR